jgi:hypothetical protein
MKTMIVVTEAELCVASVISGEILPAIAERAPLDESERLPAMRGAGNRFPMPADPKTRRGRPARE